ncbi:hypothetical protein RHSIM_Rhsim12G0093400 [Rhododendron simsii]|uniref:K-box domain-containing protein n=1 Tax=Rhododendron simsii TaxID=118357 RepID=A0A834G8Q3_RHOSS|nr:hypothetical protein RHSIM_Rhsim12G0093400 [Rhododendron simsii]
MKAPEKKFSHNLVGLRLWIWVYNSGSIHNTGARWIRGFQSSKFSTRNLLGEDLGPLSSKELESLERQLDMSLKQIRSTRTQYMLDQLTDLQRKEHALNEANKSLKQRLFEGAQLQVNSLQWNPSAQDVGYGSRQAAQPQGDGFFHPLECEPTLQIG